MPSPKTRTVEIPENVFAFIAWLLSNPRVLLVGLGTGLVLIAALLGLRANGIDVVCGVAPESMRQRLCVAGTRDLSPETQACVDEARRNNRPWVILSATLLARLEDSPDGTLRKSEFRMQYTVLALKDIPYGETVFDETFGSSYAKAAEKHYSSHEEKPHGAGDRRFDLKFAAHAGDIETFTTGIDWLYALPLSEKRMGLVNRLSLGRNQDTVEYPNGPDSVCEVRINVTSPTTRLRQVGEGMHRSYGTGDVTARALENGELHEPGRVLSARWTNVKPDEHLAIHFEWEGSGVPNQKSPAEGLGRRPPSGWSKTR